MKKEIKKINKIKHKHLFLPGTQTVTLCLIIKGGSSDETDKNSGVAHFLEHLIFSGSKKFPDSDRTLIIEEQHGMITNAWTFKDATCFYIKTPTENVALALDILFDSVFFPLLKEEIISSERNVILQEIAMRDDDPTTICFDNLLEILFKYKALSHPTIGSIKTVNNIKKNDLALFHKKYYNISNCIFFSSGNIKKEELAKHLKNFDLPQNKIRINENNNTLLNLNTDKIRITNFDLNSIYTIIGFPIFNVSSKETETLMVFNSIFSEGRSSRLYKNIKSKTGLVSEISSEFYLFKLEGMFYLCFVSTENNFNKALELSLKEILINSTKNLTNQEIQKAKTIIKSNFIYKSEKSDEIATESDTYNIGLQTLLLGKNITIKSIIKNVDSVKKEDLLILINKYFTTQKLKISVIIPKQVSKIKIISQIQKTINLF